MKTFLISALTLALFSCPANDKLIGRWESQPSENGVVTGVIFKDDDTFDGYVNKKPFVTGHYTLKGDVFSMIDNGCDGKMATYKIIFFSNSDSMRFQHINDSCEGRRNGMSRLVLG